MGYGTVGSVVGSSKAVGASVKSADFRERLRIVRIGVVGGDSVAAFGALGEAGGGVVGEGVRGGIAVVALDHPAC